MHRHVCYYCLTGSDIFIDRDAHDDFVNLEVLLGECFFFLINLKKKKPQPFRAVDHV